MRALALTVFLSLAACAHPSPPPAAPSRPPPSAEEVAQWQRGVTAFLGDQKGALRACYDQEVRRVEDQAAAGAFLTGHVKPPNLSGKLVLVIPIESDGAVRAPRLEQDTLQNARVGECLLSRAKGWHFAAPPDPEGLEIELPFAFALKGPQGG